MRRPSFLRSKSVMTMMLAAAMCAASPVHAQDDAPPPPPPISRTPVQTGSVTGHVYCADTQRPARFAVVELLVEQPGENTSTAAPAAPRYFPAASARTALDGSFDVEGVAPGDYFVTAQMTGYVSEATTARLTGTALAGSPHVHVSAHQSADATVSIERGAVISGRVLYDDGSPVAGVSIALRSPSGTQQADRSYLSFFGVPGVTAMTDERGVYRISGVPAGKYYVVTTVQVNTSASVHGSRGRDFGRGSMTVLTEYAPGTMHQTDARLVELARGSEADGVDVQVALAGLRSIKGTVEAKTDSHLLSGGYVSLADAKDSTMTRTAMIGSDGSFEVQYLPPGTYTLGIQGEERSAGGYRGFDDDDSSRTRYQRGSASVVVGEHDVAMDPVLLDTVQSSASASQAASR